MRVANEVEVKAVKAAGMVCMAAAWMLAAIPAVAQDAPLTGVSHPSSAPITVDDGDTANSTPRPAAKPSAAVPATAPTTNSETVYGPYVPYRPAGAAATGATAASADAKPFDPDANIVTSATAGQTERHLLGSAQTDEDAGIVTYVASKPGEIHEGTLMRVKLREELSTLTTQPGSKFTAEVTEPMMRDGEVVVPVGSIVEGRVTWVRGGKRIGGSAAIHLEPRTVTLPDGAMYVVRARVIDTNSWQNTKVDNEGTITRKENTKRNVGVMALTTGGGAAAGAMIGGPTGALIGAGVGAGVSTIMWLKQDRQAVLPKDLGLIFSLTEPMSVTPASAVVAPVKTGEAGGE
jgi:hypothetical protein